MLAFIRRTDVIRPPRSQPAQDTRGVGDADTALKNMPVVSGFREGQEMPPMLVAENLLGRVLLGKAGENAFDVAVQAWVADADHKAGPRRPN